MADPRKTPFDFAPGVQKIDSPYAASGRWIDMDKIRFLAGKPEKHRGYDFFAGPVSGIVRAMKAWDDFSGNRHLVVGTHRSLEHIDPAALVTNITPIRFTVAGVVNPFQTTTGSSIVVVNLNSHGAKVGDTVIISNASSVGGVVVFGPYLVIEVVTPDQFKINVAPASATSTATGGGLVTFEFEISVGSINSVQGSGYGVGPYGAGTYGTPRTNVTTYIQYSRTWALDLYGETLLAMPSGNPLYQWDPDTPALRAVLVANSPSGEFFFVTNERYPIVLGAGGALMDIAWPDQNDITDWTPTTINTANRRTLKDGSRLIAGAVLINTLSVIWSDTAVYSLQYTGARNIIYTSNKAAGQCGLIGPHAFVVVGGRAFWMSPFSFYMYAGGVTHIPKADEVESWIYGRLSAFQNWKCSAHYSSANNEVTWFYVVDGDDEPAAYVSVNLDDWSWTTGTYDRTSMEEQSGINPRIFGADVSGRIYVHDRGVDAAGAPLPWFIQSAPVDIDDGNTIMEVFGYIPNFQRQKQKVTLTVKTYDRPQDTETDNETILETTAVDIAEHQGIADFYTSGRLMSLRLEGAELGSDFRLGKQQIEIQSGGNRR